MKIFFTDKKLAKNCSAEAKCKKAYGLELAKKIMQRLNELKAADNLGIISHLPPPACHELKDNRKGQFAVKLNRNFRLIFEPEHDPIPTKNDGSIDKTKITKISILEAREDYHGK